MDGDPYAGDMPKRSSKPRDTNALAAAVVAEATGTAPAIESSDEKLAAAVELGRLGGLKGGIARAQRLSAEERSEIARKAAKARWSQHGSGA